MSDLPERLLLGLMWVCVVVAACAVAGQHRRSLVVPLAVAAVAATWRLRPARLPPARGDVLAVVLCLVFLTGWVVAQLGLTGERVVVSRDPDVYTLSALWLTDHRSPSIPVPAGSEGTLGFDLERGALQPQGAHLVPALSALVGWAGGTTGVLAANLVWGAAGLLGLFALGRRVVGAAWALLPVAALALSQPMVAFSRSMYSEPLSLALSMLAGCLLLAGWDSGRRRDLLLCGIALGALTLTRVDGLLVAGGVVAALSVLAALTGSAGSPGRRWAGLLVAAGCAPLAVLSVVDLYLYTGVYFDNSLRSVLALGVLFLAACAASAVVALAADGRLGRRLAALAPRAGDVGAGLLAAYWVVLASRRWWPSAGAPPEPAEGNPVVRALQEREGVPVDGAGAYADLALSWTAWYLGPLTVAVGLAGLAWWLRTGLRDRRQVHLVLVLVLVLPSALLYLAFPQITPDQVWAARRYLPVVLPGLLLSAVWVLGRLSLEPRVPPGVRGALAALAAVAVVGWPVSTLPGVWGVRDNGGVLAGVREVCDEVAGRPAVVSGADTLLPTVAAFCGVPVYGVSIASRTRLAEAHEALGGGDVVLVTRDTAGLPPAASVRPVEISFELWEPRLLDRPRGAAKQAMVISVGSLDGNGAVSAG